MVIGELAIPDPRSVNRFDDIPPETLHALRIIEPAIYGGPLKTVGRAAHLLRNMDEAKFNLSARPVGEAMPSGVAVVHEGVRDFWVQSIAVDPRYRGLGVGSTLMRTIEKIGRIQLCGQSDCVLLVNPHSNFMSGLVTIPIVAVTRTQW